MEPREPEKKTRTVTEILNGLVINAAMIGPGYLGSLAFAAAFPYTLLLDGVILP